MTKKYEIQTIKDKEAPSGYHYRVTEIATDSRVATCYLEENARLVCNALNACAQIDHSGKPKRACKLCGTETYSKIVNTDEAKTFALKIGDPICWGCLA